MTGASEPSAPAVNLEVICPGGQSPVVDIVSIPSLPQLLPSYQPRDETSWIRDVFSHHFPTARVLLFRYDLERSPADVSWLSILRHGTLLNYELVHRRSQVQEMNRPLVFICHSFGGMVLKQALIAASRDGEFHSIVESTIGVLFFGCIHNHAPATFEKACIRCAALEMRIPLHKPDVSPNIQDRKRWVILRETMDKFKQLNISFPIWSYCEGRKTPYKAHRWRPAESSIICAEPLTRLNTHNEQFFQVDMDHLQISKFPARSHPLFTNILEVLNGMLAACRQVQISGEITYNDGATQTFDINPGRLINETETSISMGDSLEVSNIPQSPRARRTKLPCRSILPRKDNLHFTGREDVLSHIYSVLRPDKPDDKFKAQSVFVLCGLGGIGKTQIAIRFALEYMGSFEAVLFAHADEPTNLSNDFARFAIQLGIVDPGESDYLYCCEQMKRWFEETDAPWLLVFDNADNPEKSLSDFWPQCDRGSILITTRAQSLAAKFGCRTLPPLQENEAVDLLIKLTGMSEIYKPAPDTPMLDNDHTIVQHGQQEAALQIVQRLGCLPLGIYQAANLIVNDCCCSFTEFISAYDHRDLFTSAEDANIFRLPNEEAYSHSLNTVWSMSFNTLPDESKHILNMLSFLNPDRIELRMLTVGADRAFKAGESGWSAIADPKLFLKHKAKILHSSLLDQHREENTLSMHRLVGVACQHRMTPGERQMAFYQASSLLHHLWPVAPRKNRHRPDLWPMQERLIPHVLSLCRFYEESQKTGSPLTGTIEFAELLYNASWHNYERGTFEFLEPLLCAAQHYCLRNNGCELILADIYGARASVATETNQPNSALENFRLQYKALGRAVELGMITLPDIRFCFGLGGMANGTHAMGFYEEAEQWYRKCFEAFKGLDADKRMYGGNLAFCLIWQGKLDEARSVISPILDSAPDRGFRTVLTFCRTGYIMYPLGNLQIAMSQLDKAYKTHSDALDIYRNTLGDKHHRTADLCHKVAWHHHSRKEYTQAVDLLRQALAVFDARPIWYRNERARTMFKLGCVLQDSGNTEEGQLLVKQAEELRREILRATVPPGDEKEFDTLVMFWSR